MVQDISTHSTNNLKEGNILSQNMCVICFLYHFDLDSKYVIDGINENDFREIKDEIEEIIGKELIKITYNEKMIMKTPAYLRNINPNDYPINKGYLSMDIKLSNQVKSSSKDYRYHMELIMAYIDLFDTGVATVNLQFELNFEEGLDSFGIYNAYEKIYSKIRDSLKEKQIESEELSILKQIHDIIKNIRNKLRKGELYNEGQEWTLSQYPLFCLPKIHVNKLKKLFSLLYLKPKIDDLEEKIQYDPQLKETIDQYSTNSKDNHFIPMWNAALLIDNDRENIESYVKLLELCSYIWLSAFLFRSYLINELDRMSKQFDSSNNLIVLMI